MQALADFTPLLETYDYFLIDLWGTVHDGKRLFPGVKERLQHLKDLQKTVIFLSNAPRPSNAVQQLLTELELTSRHYDALITSGDLFLADVRKTPHLQEPFYYIGDSVLHASLLEALHVPTKDLNAANYILCSGASPNYEMLLKEALAQKKLLVCVNPDLVVVDDGRTIPCAGSVAKDYADKGGDVVYYGKPHTNTYDYAFESLGNPPKEKVLMIGDGLYTDILGANQYGIHSLLVNTGVHRVTDLADPRHALAKLSQHLGMEPTYFLETLGEKYTPV
jgi:HAD superfamily hydrolase (TIGR01459 family)